ncbi:MAG: hypothetical protein E3J72_01965 [Planctomycetota bacterium]|nr:MAG: hypothetical protein E3J72_01965 [Planctomycetota bacterium]
MNEQISSSTGSDSSLRLAVVSTTIILVMFGLIIAAYFLYRHRGKLLNPGKKKGDFLETFDDGTIDPKLVIVENGAASHSVNGGELFFDQTTSVSDAHVWYYDVPLDLSRPFVARVRTKTDNYVVSGGIACNPLVLYINGTQKPRILGGSTLEEGFIITYMEPSGGRTYVVFMDNLDGHCWWNFTTDAWASSEPPANEMCRPMDVKSYATLEFWSTPKSFYFRLLDKNGKLLYKTAPKVWSDFSQLLRGADVYLSGGEWLSSWLSNDEWIDYIQVKYER